MDRKNAFSIKEHVPKYSRILFEALKTPILIYFAVAGNMITFVSAAIFFLFERETNGDVVNYFDAVWWSFCTVSTVGFGDIVPVTTGGRLTGMFLIVTGVIFFISYTAILVSVVTKDLVEAELD